MTAVPYSQTMLILDDVLIPKPYAKCIQGAYWDHDRQQNRQNTKSVILTSIF